MLYLLFFDLFSQYLIRQTDAKANYQVSKIVPPLKQPTTSVFASSMFGRSQKLEHKTFFILTTQIHLQVHVFLMFI